ncbi:nuclear transport factor 2 family protein [Streptomyces sp. NPDC020412]|uniref:nuclear transport factor 2 family protein n=1 Tax=Streptomyces sp. NPDC020412 TaxID=3365073 RepID=UPI00378BFEB1
MTQRVDLSTVMDRLAIDDLVTGYAVAVDDGDWSAFLALFTDDGRVDYRSPGGTEGPVAEVAQSLAESMRLFSVRQHLIVNRRVTIQDLGGYPGDRAEVQADYVNPMRLESGEVLVGGGRYLFSLTRTDDGWRLSSVVVEERWRRTEGDRSS